MSEEFLQKCRDILGTEYVMLPEDAEAYTTSTLGTPRIPISGVLKPRSTREISALVEIARGFRVPLYPISIGNNWGYGSKTPTREWCAVVDLSRMNTITQFDASLGIITVEPGVTTSDVEKFLKEAGDQFMSPVIGAGPRTSMIGNVLEKGISSTAFNDRLSSLVSLEAVLPDGSVFNSESGAGETGNVSPYKWGLGPYLDGLFVQSNLGIVTKASFYLTRKPAYEVGLFIPINSITQLDALVHTMHTLTRKLSGNITTFQIEGPVRTYAHYTLRNTINLDAREVLTKEALKERLLPLRLGEWNCCAIVQGEKPVVRAALKIAKHDLRSAHLPFSLHTRSSIKRWRAIVNALPEKLQGRFMRLRMLGTYIERTTGTLGTTNGWLPFWRNISVDTPTEETTRKRTTDIDSQEECGFLFFVAAFPANAKCAEIISLVEEIARKHSIEPLCGLLFVPNGYLHFSLQMTYDRRDPKRVAGAFAAYEEVFRLTHKYGALPYRVPNPMHHLLKEVRPEYWPLAQRIKKAVDPNNIISPGRYIPDVE